MSTDASEKNNSRRQTMSRGRDSGPAEEEALLKPLNVARGQRLDARESVGSGEKEVSDNYTPGHEKKDACLARRNTSTRTKAKVPGAKKPNRGFGDGQKHTRRVVNGSTAVSIGGKTHTRGLRVSGMSRAGVGEGPISTNRVTTYPSRNMIN